MSAPLPAKRNDAPKAPDPRPVRLPYYSQLESEFGIDKAAWRVLVEAIFPAAKTVEAVLMALAYCRQRNLDPFKRLVHIVPMYSSALRKEVETVWPGIGELRTTAFRTKQYAGMDAAEVGPMITETFTGSHTWDNKAEKREATVTFQEWMRITVYRIIDGQRYSFVGPKVYWKETYARWKGTEVPNDRWRQAPNQQHEKCAQAAALRNAFPEELGNEYAAEEMEGRTLLPDMEPRVFSEPPNPNLAPMIEHAAVPAPEPAPKEASAPVNEVKAAEIIAGFREFSGTAKNIDELLEYSATNVDDHYDLWPKDKQVEFDRAYRLAAGSLPESE